MSIRSFVAALPGSSCAGAPRVRSMIGAAKRAPGGGGNARSHGSARWRIDLQPPRAAAGRIAMTTEARERRIEAVLARYREVLRQRRRDEPPTLDEIEQAVEAVGQ